jgi:hypothetical protein
MYTLIYSRTVYDINEFPRLNASDNPDRSRPLVDLIQYTELNLSVSQFAISTEQKMESFLILTFLNSQIPEFPSQIGAVMSMHLELHRPLISSISRGGCIGLYRIQDKSASIDSSQSESEDLLQQ